MKTKMAQKEKRSYGISLSADQVSAARKWAYPQDLGISTIASAAINLLCDLPLTNKELLIEQALREKLGAPVSASEAQILRRLDALEHALQTLQPAQQIHDHSQTTNHVTRGGVVAKTAFVTPPGDSQNAP